MAETLLVLRDGNGNHNSSPTFLFSICSHPRIPRVSMNMDTSCRRKSNNGKRTRKRTRPIRFECSNAIRNGIMFDFYPGLLHFIQISTTLLASFFTISEVEHPSVACWSSLQYSFSPVFVHLALLQDSFYRHFLIMWHISNVGSYVVNAVWISILVLHRTNNSFLSNA